MAKTRTTSVTPAITPAAVFLSPRAIWFSLVLVVLLGLFFNAVSSILTPFVVGLVLAYCINPLVTSLQKMGLPRPFAAAIPVGGAVLLLAVVLVLVLPALAEQVASFANRLPIYLMTLEQYLPGRLSRMLDLNVNPTSVLRQLGLLSTKGAQLTVAALQQTLSGALWLFNLLLLIIMTPLVAFYLLMDWPQIMQTTFKQTPKPWRARVQQVGAAIDTKLAAYLRGTMAVCLTMGVYYACAITLVGPIASMLLGAPVAGLELGWAIGLFTGILTFLPIIGATMGVTLMLVVALVQYQLQIWEPYALLLGIFMLGQMLEGYVLTPQLVGNRVGLHPLWVIFALMAGGAIAGIFGMLLAVPVAVIISVLLPRLLATWRESVE